MQSTRSTDWLRLTGLPASSIDTELAKRSPNRRPRRPHQGPMHHAPPSTGGRAPTPRPPTKPPSTAPERCSKSFPRFWAIEIQPAERRKLLALTVRANLGAERADRRRATTRLLPYFQATQQSSSAWPCRVNSLLSPSWAAAQLWLGGPPDLGLPSRSDLRSSPKCSGACLKTRRIQASGSGCSSRRQPRSLWRGWRPSSASANVFFR